MEESDIQQLRWYAKNPTQSSGQASALAGLAISEAVRDFKTSSDRLGKRMVILTWGLVALTAILVVLTVELIVTT